MNISRENIDDLNVILKVRVEQTDYEERVSKILEDYRRKVRMDGFRPGKVPPGLVRKLYRKSILIEEINKIVSESVSRYLAEEKIRVLGEPLPSESVSPNIDWDSQTEFEFAFDLGLAPEFDLSLGPRDKIPFYEIQIDKSMVDSYTENATRRFGSFVSSESAGETSYLKGDIQQLDEQGNLAGNGIRNEDVSISVNIIKDEKIKSTFLGLKAGEHVDFDVKKAFPNDTEISAMLAIKKDQVKDLFPMFRYTISSISQFENAPVNQELFDKIYGKDQVTSEKMFYEKIEEEIAANLLRESNYRFQIDAKNYLVEKYSFRLPAGFLKRWLFTINEGKYTREQIDHDFEHFENDLKWQLIRDRITRDHQITVTEEELIDLARQITISQFMQYGISNFPDDQIEGYARDLLKREEDKKRIHDRKIEEKVYNFIRETVKMETKKVSSEAFNKLFEKDNKHTDHEHE